METFKKPLTSKEEAKFLDLLTHGTPSEAKHAKDMLIEHNLRLVAHIAKKYQSSDLDPQDLISIGTIGLIKGILSFDNTKKSKLATYASKCIENELLMMLRSRKKLSREVSIHEPIGTDKEGNEISLLDILSAEQTDIVENMDFQEKSSKLYCIMQQVLSEREREIIFLRYGLITGKEITQREIGSWLGLSRSYISRIEKKALEKMRLEYEKNAE